MPVDRALDREAVQRLQHRQLSEVDVSGSDPSRVVRIGAGGWTRRVELRHFLQAPPTVGSCPGLGGGPAEQPPGEPDPIGEGWCERVDHRTAEPNQRGLSLGVRVRVRRSEGSGRDPRSELAQVDIDVVEPAEGLLLGCDAQRDQRGHQVAGGEVPQLSGHVHLVA